MPFRRKGAAALTERLDVRVSPEEKETAPRDGRARRRDRSPSWCASGPSARPIIPRSDATTIRELRRLGGLLKKVHVDSRGAYSEGTARRSPPSTPRSARLRRDSRMEKAVAVIVKKVQTNKRAAPKSRAAARARPLRLHRRPGRGRSRREGGASGRRQLLNLDHAAAGRGDGRPGRDGATIAPARPALDLELAAGRAPDDRSGRARPSRMFLGELGLGEHQCIYALHRNTDNYHLHLAMNRVHPETERVVTVNGGFDIEVAHRAVARIEHAQGWQREAGGRYRVREDGELQRDPSRHAAAERQPTTRARDFENRTGREVRAAARHRRRRGSPATRAKSGTSSHVRLAEQAMRLREEGEWRDPLDWRGSGQGLDRRAGLQPVRAGEAARHVRSGGTLNSARHPERPSPLIRPSRTGKRMPPRGRRTSAW